MGENRLAILQANDSFAMAADIARTFQNQLKNDDSRSCNSPKPLSIPQDVPFMMADDVIQYAQGEIEGVEWTNICKGGHGIFVVCWLLLHNIHPHDFPIAEFAIRANHPGSLTPERAISTRAHTGWRLIPRLRLSAHTTRAMNAILRIPKGVQVLASARFEWNIPKALVIRSSISIVVEGRSMTPDWATPESCGILPASFKLWRRRISRMAVLRRMRYTAYLQSIMNVRLQSGCPARWAESESCCSISLRIVINWVTSRAEVISSISWEVSICIKRADSLVKVSFAKVGRVIRDELAVASCSCKASFQSGESKKQGWYLRSAWLVFQIY